MFQDAKDEEHDVVIMTVSEELTNKRNKFIRRAYFAMKGLSFATNYIVIFAWKGQYHKLVYKLSMSKC